MQLCETVQEPPIMHDRNGKLSLDSCLQEQVLLIQLTVQLEEVKN